MEPGKLVLITGPMFCGKTEELIRIATRYTIANKKVVMFKPKKDGRYGKGVIVAHNEQCIRAEDITKLEDIIPRLININTKIHGIFIDEIQFIENVNIKTIRYLTEEMGIDLYASGLTLDSFREPFKEILGILPYAEIIQLTSVCDFCGGFSAIYTHRKSNKPLTQVLVGGKESYCAICAKCLSHKERQDEK